MANGLPLPGRIAANGWLLVGGEKMSKSNLTGISPETLTAHFGVDAYRWYFLRAIAFGQDGSFSWEDFTARYTSELANGYGNLASRVTAMTARYFNGTLPAPGEETEAERSLKSALLTATSEADHRIGDQLDFQGGILAVFDFVRQVNGYLTDQEPWKVAKTDSPEARDRLATILYTAADSLRAIAILLEPIMPETSQHLWDSLGASTSLGPLRDQHIRQASDWGHLPPGSPVTKGAALFPRVDS
jgi:methionyl-tRNA synthetase